MSTWLTIVTVVKDDLHGFTRTIESIAAQADAGIEFIVIDSSVDQTAIPAALAAADVRAQVQWTPPAGIYSAMNLGLEQANGEHTMFVNAGDELCDGAIATIKDAVREHNPIWMFGDIEIVGVDGTTTTTPAWDYEEERAHAFSRGKFPPHQATIVRTSTLRNAGGFDTSYSIVADYVAFLRFSDATPLRLDHVLARFGEGGVSTIRWHQAIREFHRARREVLRPHGPLATRELMSTARQFLAMAVYRSPWPLTIGLTVVATALMVLTGVSIGSALMLSLVVVAQGLGGALWWRMLRPGAAVLELIGMGLGLGTAASLLTGLIGTSRFPSWWVAPAIAVAVWFATGRRRRRAPIAPLMRSDLWALAAGLVPGIIALLVALRAYPLHWTGMWAGYHGDMLFFEALSTSVARFGANASIFMNGAELRYHSLAYGWAGQVTAAVDAAPFVVLTRLLPIVTLVAVIALAGSWTRRLTSARWTPALAVLLVVTGGFVGATFGSVLNFDSPSQSMGAMWLLALAPLFLDGIGARRIWWYALPLAMLMVALTGGKISTSVVAAAGIGVTALASLVRRDLWRRNALVLTAVAAVAFVGTYIWLLAGSAEAGGLQVFSLLDRASSVQALNPVITPRGILAGIVLLILAVLPRFAGLAWLAADPEWRRRPETAFGVGVGVTGVGALIVLSGGFNDLWFAVAAAAPLGVLSAIGTERAWRRVGSARQVGVAAVVGLVTSVVVAAIWATGSTGVIGDGWRWAGPLVGLAVALVAAVVLARRSTGPYRPTAAALVVIICVVMATPARLVYAVAEPLSRPREGSISTVLFSVPQPLLVTIDQSTEIGWSDTQAQAGAWLDEHAGINDIVMTNRTLSALVPALSRRATYISDIHMQAPYGRAGDLEEIKFREIVSWWFIDHPEDPGIIAVCKGNVRWVWVDPRVAQTDDWSPDATVVWQADDVTLLRIDPATCAAALAN